MKEVRTTVLNVLSPSSRKLKLLDEMLERCKATGNHLFETCRYYDVLVEDAAEQTRNKLQSIEYEHIRDAFGIPSQPACDLCKDVFASFSTTEGQSFSSYSIPYNVPRSGTISTTKRGNPVVSATMLNGRIALPIAKDGAWKRFSSLIDEGYEFSAFKLLRRKTGWQIHVPLKREYDIPMDVDSILGIDVGSRCLAAVTLLGCDGIKKQLYLGKDLWEHQRDLNIRRGKLRAHKDKGSCSAARKIRDMRKRESDFVKTRCFQVAHQIVDIAKENKSLIAIENLKHLNKSKLHRKGNRRAKRMPYAIFRAALESVCMRNFVPLTAVDPYHTSRSCPSCGKLGARPGKGKVFHCRNCGRIVNADRNASLNIALRAGKQCIEANTSCTSASGTQHSERKGRVNGLVRQDDRVVVIGSHLFYAPDCKPTIFSRG